MLKLTERFSTHFMPLLAGAVLFSLQACSNVPMQDQALDSTPSATTTESEIGKEQRQVPKRPDLELTEDILYKLLVAEVAGQRGQLDISVENYLDLARTTRDHEIASRATRIAVYARQDEAAFEAAKIWVELDPENTDAHQVLAVMAVRDGDLETAMHHFDFILKNSEDAIDQKLWVIANMLSKDQDQEVVKKVLGNLMQGHQDNPESLYAYAHVMSRMNEDDKALEILEKVLKIVPDNLNATISYVAILQKQGKGAEALAWLEEALQKTEDNFNLRLFYARLLTDEKRFEDARTQFEILVTEAPNNIDVLYALGLLNLQGNRLDEAEVYFQRLSELGENSEEANYYLGRIAEERGEIEKATAWYEGIQQGNNYFDAQVRLAFLIAKDGRPDDARKHLQNIRAENPVQQNILTQAEGEILMDGKHYDDALTLYNKALEGGYNSELLYARAMLAEKMDRLDILEEDLSTIIEREPDNAMALNALGYTLADRTDRYTEAYALVKRALELKPNDFYILDSMGWVLYRMGRLDEAIVYLNRALKERRDPEIAAHLGEVLWVKGDKAAAREVWDTALKETPDDTKLLDVIKRFIP
jgi:tetratricopeptide (TPR) repeat protein